MILRRVSKHSIFGYITRWAVLTYIIGALLGASGTAADPQTTKTFSFAVLGDNRPGGQQIAPSNTFIKIMKELSALKPEFVINTGDFVDGSKDAPHYQKQADAVKKLLSELKIRMFIAPGNHDIRSTETSAIFEREFNRHYFSFDHENSHFIVLSTQVPGESGRITGAQRNWLERDLEKSRNAEHKFVFYHQPLWPVDGHINSSLDIQPKERDDLARLFRKYRVDATFAGHEHLFHYTDKDGVKEYITGGAGAGLYRTREGGFGGFHHYLWVTVSPGGVRVMVVLPGKKFNPSQPPKDSWLTPEKANSVK